jgi:glutaredoxin
MASITMYGADWSSDCRRSKTLLDGLGVDFEYVDVELSKEAADRAQAISGRINIPVIAFADGSFQVEPSDDALRGKLAAVGAL